MKKEYNAPLVEKVEFNYREQVVASNGGGKNCIYVWQNEGLVGCEGTQTLVGYLK